MSDDQIVAGVHSRIRAGDLSGAAQRFRMDRAVRRGRVRTDGDLGVPEEVSQSRGPWPKSDRIELDDPALAKYKDQIEKDLANLE